MDRQFLPFAGPGFGFNPFFRPFPHPFFPGRFLFPFFAFSPFFFPFFRGEDDRNDMCFAQYQVQSGDTLWKIAHMFNIPLPILEEANPQIGNPNVLRIGETIFIPRISHMYCQKTYVEMPMTQGQQPTMS